MTYLIGWGLFIIAVIGIGVIVGRKAGVLANINVDEIASEKAKALKQQIIADRLERRLSKWGVLMLRIVKPVSKFLRNSFDKIYDALNAWQRNQANRAAALNQDIDKRIEVLLAEAEEMIRAGRFDAAEKKYIEIIGLDPKNFTAFRELGEVYFEKESLNEARQTLEHALELRRKTTASVGGQPTAKDLELAQAHYLLASVHEEMGDYVKAVSQLKKALKIEENSPRYLDRLIEVSILKKDKSAALEAYDRLLSANPENQKLEQFKERIAGL